MVLGSGMRASAALSGAERAPGGSGGGEVAGQPALDKQIAAVDTAWGRRSSDKKKSARKKKRTTSGSTGQRTPAGRAVSRSGGGLRTTVYYMGTESGKIDLDVAGAAQLEQLPRIGPVLAARIVADRDSLGPFGSLEEFERVKGVGPALLRTLSPYVTFSLRPRPSTVNDHAGRAPPERVRRRPRRPDSS